MSAGHTPGPWGIEMARARLWVGPRRPDGSVVDNVCCFNLDDKHGQHFLARQAANARLIAAAPEFAETAPDAADLLERYAAFIRTVRADDLELHPYLPEVERVAEELRLAIAKATGSPNPLPNPDNQMPGGRVK